MSHTANKTLTFVDYVYCFYGPDGLYPMGATKEQIREATKILASSGCTLQFDSVDREAVSDILIQRFGLVFPLAKKDVPSNMSHTPGPWDANKWATGWSISARNEHYTVCTLDGCNNDKANAKLIAAATDLLAICQRLHLHVNGLNATMRATSLDYRSSPLCKALDELIRDNATAIAKATTE